MRQLVAVNDKHTSESAEEGDQEVSSQGGESEDSEEREEREERGESDVDVDVVVPIPMAIVLCDYVDASVGVGVYWHVPMASYSTNVSECIWPC